MLQRYFWPGFDSTGPNQSVMEMIRALSDRFRFRVIADATPDEEAGRWTELHGIERLPLRAGWLGSKGLRETLIETPHAAILANSFFDPTQTIATLLLRRFGRIPYRPLLLASRGEFARSALATKPFRKNVYLRTMRAAGLLSGVIMQATDEREAADVARALGPNIPIVITPNIRTIAPLPFHPPRQPGEALRIAFLGRIDRIKNLDFALDRLREADVPARFNMYGVSLDEPYWLACRQSIERLPPHIVAKYHGVIPNGEVLPMMARHDLLLLPTGGENFGHAIVDSLAAGTPVLISDRTRWRGLEAEGAGWDVSLEDGGRFVAAIREAAGEDAEARARRRAAARSYIERAIHADCAIAIMTKCLESLVNNETVFRA
ncbi:MAG: glycosyltransferase [Sphingosinicella sp.]